MTIGKNAMTLREMQLHYPKMYNKLYEKITSKSKKIKKQNQKKIKLEKKAKKEGIAKEEVGIKLKFKKASIKKPKVDPKEKKEVRLQKHQGKLLTQLQFLQQRIETMERDKESYALVDFNINEEKTFKFVIVKIGDPCQLTLTVKNDMQMHCSCMDFKIRCREMAVPCKHIYYLLVKILTYELYDYFDNQILEEQVFKDLVKARINIGGKNFSIKADDDFLDEMCPICYTMFSEKDNKDEILKCPDCCNFVHKNCMMTWMNHSPRRNCVLCKSEKWNMLFADHNF